MLEFVIDQVGDDLVHEALALVGAAHGHAAEGVLKAAAGGDDLHVIVIHGAGVFKIGIAADPLRLEQAVDLGLPAAVGSRDSGNIVIGHEAFSFC